MAIFILPSEDDCGSAPEENLAQNSAGLKSLQTRMAQVSGGESRCSDLEDVIAWPHIGLRGNPKKDSRIGHFSHSTL